MENVYLLAKSYLDVINFIAYELYTFKVEQI